ncbi:alpha/beta hydrolase family protein [Maribacter sp. 2307UL18-2]|uniref:alpha/beta hydrolase family protein n=1 Tax=Maribacter sp. 2307UL18-2 TaxID=3386274 RepID=UPI0039BC27C0
MFRYFIIALAQIVTINVLAQTNGKIVSKTRIQNFDEFIGYILKTETLDPKTYDPLRHTKLDSTRYTLLEDIELFGITYLSDGLKVKGFLLLPSENGKFPCIIYNRGGSLEHGSLTHYVSSIGIGELARLAKAGFVVVASQYRGNGGSEGKEEYGGADINDVTNLFPLLKSEPKADLGRLGMFGWSRGGMTTFLTLKGKKLPIKAVVVGGSSVNLVRAIKDRPPLDEWWGTFIPEYKTPKRQEVLRKRSAIFWVDKLPKDIPFLILQGSDDKSASTEENLKFVSKLQSNKIPYRYIVYENGNHGLSDYRDEVFQQVTSWFRKFL